MSELKRRDFPSCEEVALGAFLHDVGKFYQRARGSTGKMTREVFDRASVILPSYQGRSSHWHALWSDAFFSETIDANPFPANLDRRWVRDCAVFHHRPGYDAIPNSAVTWIVAEADRMAAGMERKVKDEEEDAEPSGMGRHGYRQTVLTSIFAKVTGLVPGAASSEVRQSLSELTASNLEPVAGDKLNPTMPEAYSDLWARFVTDYQDLAHRTKDRSEAFHQGILALSEKYMWAIPSSTIDEPDVSLHDHGRAAAALAACLHRHHESDGSLSNEAAIRDRSRLKFRFIVGDLSGIQTALFRLASEGTKGIARTLRGRSMRIQLIGDVAAERALSTFKLPPYCILQNAGGRFVILTPFIDDDGQRADLDALRTDVDQWMRAQYQGDLSLNLSMTAPFAAADLFNPTAAKNVLSRIGQAAEEAKQRPLRGARSPKWEATRWDSEKGICTTCGARPATETDNIDKQHRCVACHGEVQLGRAYPKALAVVVDRQAPAEKRDTIMGFHIDLPSDTGTKRVNLGWRIRGEADGDGLPAADRFAGAYVPRHTAETLTEKKFAAARNDADEDAPDVGDILTFAELAALSTNDGKGRPMLAALKADVDRLGQVFSKGLGEKRSLARTGALSRMMDAFFTGKLPDRLKTEFPNIYTVYAGGDDLLLLGPWYDILRFAKVLRSDFAKHVGNNGNITLSCGIALFGAKTPITLAAHEAEERLEVAKNEGRNRINVISSALEWSEYEHALTVAERLDALLNDDKSEVSTALLYKLLHFDDQRIALARGDLNAAGWMAKLGYHLWRTLPDGKGNNEQTRAFLLGLLGISPNLEAAKSYGKPTPARIALTIAIYRNR